MQDVYLFYLRAVDTGVIDLSVSLNLNNKRKKSFIKILCDVLLHHKCQYFLYGFFIWVTVNLGKWPTSGKATIGGKN